MAIFSFYAGNMIRVINIYTAKRALLRGHVKSITDLRFYSDDMDLLGSVGKDGFIFLWKISEEKKPAETQDEDSGVT